MGDFRVPAAPSGDMGLGLRRPRGERREGAAEAALGLTGGLRREVVHAAGGARFSSEEMRRALPGEEAMGKGYPGGVCVCE